MNSNPQTNEIWVSKDNPERLILIINPDVYNTGTRVKFYQLWGKAQEVIKHIDTITRRYKPL
jgi:hypothetical protein